jgi:hypothetical protein
MLPAAEKLESLAVIHNHGWEYPQKQYDDAWRANLLFAEHTWGAFLSGTDPQALLQKTNGKLKNILQRKGPNGPKGFCIRQR